MLINIDLQDSFWLCLFRIWVLFYLVNMQTSV